MAKPSRRRGHTKVVPAASASIRPGGLSIIFVAALILRLLYVLSIRDAPFFQHLQTEPQRYDEWAALILGGARAPAPPFEQAPGYAYFVAAVYAVCGRSLTAVTVVQALLDAATCALVGVAARRWFGARAGMLAGVLAALYGPSIYFTGELLPSTLFNCVCLLAIVVSLAASKEAARAWTVAGCLWSLALLVRSEIVLAWPFVCADAWRRGGRRATMRIALPMALVLVVGVAVNAMSSRKFVLFTTSGGVNLWLGNNPHADGVNPFVYGPLEEVADAARAGAADAVDLDRIFTRHALAFWRDDPAAAVQLLWKKFVWIWTDRELPNSSDIDWQTAQSWLFRVPLFPLRFGVVLPLALAGALLLGRRWLGLPLLASLIVVGVGTSLLFFTNARFRLIMVPPLVMLAAFALDRFAACLPTWRDHQAELGRAASGVVIGLVIAWGNFYGVRDYQIPQISVNTGALEREAGALDAAVHHLRAGLALYPRDAIGWVHLALALEQQGQVEAARQAYHDALALMPDDPTLKEMAGRFVARRGGQL